MTEEEFKEKLNLEQYRVMRQKDTERPFSGRYWDNEDNGIYLCAACANPLFLSLAQFDADTGWPSFTGPIDQDHVDLKKEGTQTEVLCRTCQSHLGYVVPDEKDSSKSYYRINSAALDFHEIELPEKDEEGEDDEKKKKEVKNAATVTAQTIVYIIVSAAAGTALGWGTGSYLCQSQSMVPLTQTTSTPSASSSPIPTSAAVIKTTLPILTPVPSPTPTPPTAGSAR